MEMPDLGELTRRISTQSEGKPPDLILEWHEKLRSTGDYVFLWAGATKRGISWMSSWVNVGEDEEHPGHIEATPPAHVERLLSPMAHEGRIRIMQLLHAQPRTSGELTEATGLRGGALHYHLKELLYAAYIRQETGRYDLTQLGRQLLIAFCLIAREAIADRGDEGLAAGANWETAEDK